MAITVIMLAEQDTDGESRVFISEAIELLGDLFSVKVFSVWR